MSFESLQRVADAAGFAMASDENEFAGFVGHMQVLAPAETAEMKAAAGFYSYGEPIAHWARAQFNQFLPVWPAKA